MIPEITDSADLAAPTTPSRSDSDSPADAAEHLLPAPAGFADLALPEPLLRALTDKGYELPTPIQQLAIPLLLAGRDVIGQAQTGTGKTAAFSLPLLQRIDPQVQAVQALVLVPTRELALQVATAIHAYAQHLPRVSVLPIFGGDSMDRQITRLGRGVHAVVGTPGRILDHLRRGSLDLSQVRFLVLDEADEMLRMGFLEDVEAIIEKIPADRQTTLLSATMPPAIRRIARHHLREPEHVVVQAQTVTVENTEQRVAIVPEELKLEAVARILETEEPEATLIFTRTRLGAAELAEKLSARGFPAESLHSDLSQSQRLTVLSRLRERRAQVVVATDVAARGLDIDHITHVINYDLPGDAETYVHRIGRTGRAGRAGVALLLATPYQRPVLRTIERFTQKPLMPLTLPTYSDVAERRRERLKTALVPAVREDDLERYRALCTELAALAEREPLDVAAAVLRFFTAERPLFFETKAYDPLARLAQLERSRPESARFPARRDAGPARSHDAAPYHARGDRDRGRVEGPRSASGSADRARILLSVGHSHGVRPSDIVGAIANEAGLSGRDIGRIEINDQDSVAEIPAAALAQVLASLRNATVRGQAARPRVLPGGAERERPQRRSFASDAPGFQRDRPQRRSFAEDSFGGDREPPPRRSYSNDASADSSGFQRDRPQHRSFSQESPGADRERPQRRPFSKDSAGFQRDRPQHRSFSQESPGADRERPQRRSFSADSSGFQRDRPQHRSFSQESPGADRERPQRRSFSEDAPGRPPRRSFADAAPGAERERPRGGWNDSHPSGQGAPAFQRAKPRERSHAGGWSWGTGAPSADSSDRNAPANRSGAHPPKRRPR